MSILDQPEIDFAEINTEYQLRVDITGNDRRADEDFALFVGALRSAIGLDGFISQNDVRVLLLEDTVDGPRCSIEQHRFSAFYKRARKAGLIELDGFDRCETSPTGNNGKPQNRYHAVSLHP